MSDTDSMIEEQEMEEVIVLIEGELPNSESDTDMDTDYDTDENSVMDDPVSLHIQNQVEIIYSQECEFLESEKVNNQYYVGLYTGFGKYRLLLNIAIQPKTFLRFDIASLTHYLVEYSTFPVILYYLETEDVKIQIMKLNIEPTTKWHNVILKTYWIRIIQRTWKRVFRERQNALLKRRTCQNIRYFELHGKHLPEIRVLPGLYGMLQ